MIPSPITPEQREALAHLSNLVNPSTITALAANGDRKTWRQIDDWFETLAPLLRDSSPPTPPADA